MHCPGGSAGVWEVLDELEACFFAAGREVEIVLRVVTGAGMFPGCDGELGAQRRHARLRSLAVMPSAGARRRSAAARARKRWRQSANSCSWPLERTSSAAGVGVVRAAAAT